MGISGWKGRMPWFIVFVFVLLPLYAATAAFAIRSGIFDLADRSITSDEYKAFWAFLASGFATAVSLVGLMFTRSANERSSHQLGLDTVVKGLELLVNNDGEYARPAKVAGALSALVHLGHPVIAMRSLAVAWDDRAADPATACWLVSEVFRRGSEESMLEASKLLWKHAGSLFEEEGEDSAFAWPDALYDEWPLRVPLEGRYMNLRSVIRLALSRDREWFTRQGEWIGYLLYLIVQNDRQLASTATEVVKAFSHSPEEPLIDQYSTKNGRIVRREDIRKLMLRPRGKVFYIGILPQLTAIQAWMQQGQE
jgi:hypothetical protein